MLKKCLVTPKKNRFISGILPNRKRIDKPMILLLENWQIKRCMSQCVVIFIDSDGDEVPIHERNWNKTPEELEIDSTIEPPVPDNKLLVAKVGYCKVGASMVG